MSRAAPERNRGRSLVLGVLAVVALGSVTLFFVYFERVEEEIETGFHGEARSNPFLACERLFSLLGAPARSVPQIYPLPPTDHALFLLSPRPAMGETSAEGVLEWVARGGRLVVAPQAGGEPPVEPQEDPIPSSDPLLFPFQVVVIESEAEPGDEREVVSVQTHPGAEAARLAVSPFPRLEDAGENATFRSGSEDGDVLLRYEHGEGEITVLSDVGFLHNAEIGDYDHARFAWSLLTAGRRPAGVWVVYRDRVPSLFQVVAQQAWMPLVSLFLLLGAVLWRNGFAFGPRLPPASGARRSLLEHVSATGEFLWRRADAEELLEATRRAVLRRVELQHPGFSSLAPAERVERLSQLAQLSRPTLHQALTGNVGRDGAKLTQAIRTLERIRRSL